MVGGEYKGFVDYEAFAFDLEYLKADDVVDTGHLKADDAVDTGYLKADDVVDTEPMAAVNHV
jgi:hypothetical protein